MENKTEKNRVVENFIKAQLRFNQWVTFYIIISVVIFAVLLLSRVILAGVPKL